MNPVETARERAKELGRILGQSEEYRALERARARLEEDRALVKTLSELSELEARITQLLRSGEEPGEDVKSAYEQSFSELQSSPLYQGLVAAQSNFDKIVGRVNEDIVAGIEAGAKSRIILS
jgi:cell fate (sporulation/competence/biofilm development) regulator YlbF (YheA/YmcA/DUF963 family)